MLGLTGSAVLGCPPELAYDIDDQVDYDYAIGLQMEMTTTRS
jgi:hypothetical protein